MRLTSASNRRHALASSHTAPPSSATDGDFSSSSIAAAGATAHCLPTPPPSEEALLEYSAIGGHQVLGEDPSWELCGHLKARAFAAVAAQAGPSSGLSSPERRSACKLTSRLDTVVAGDQPWACPFPCAPAQSPWYIAASPRMLRQSTCCPLSL